MMRDEGEHRLCGIPPQNLELQSNHKKTSNKSKLRNILQNIRRPQKCKGHEKARQDGETTRTGRLRSQKDLIQWNAMESRFGSWNRGRTLMQTLTESD